MAIKFRCPHCSQLLGISTTKAGTIVDCPACGRSVNVPTEDGAGKTTVPKQSSNKDPGLLSALQELSALGGQTTHDSAAATPPNAAPRERKSPVLRTLASQPGFSPDKARDTMRIVPLTNHAHGNVGPATQPDDVLSDIAKISPLEYAEPQIPDEPPETADSSLSRACAAPVSTSTTRPDSHDLTSALQELAIGPPTAQPSAIRSQQGIPESNSKRSAFLPLMFAMPAFAIGLLIGTFWKSQGTQNSAEPIAKVGDVIPAAMAPVPETGERQINGIVTYIDDSGSSIADAGATVLVLSTENTTRLRLDARPLREATDSKARQAIESALKMLGGTVVQTDSSGRWTAITSANTTLNVIVISRHRARTKSQAVPADVLASLSNWFDSPLHIVGRLTVQQTVVPPASDTDPSATPLQIEFARVQ